MVSFTEKAPGRRTSVPAGDLVMAHSTRNFAAISIAGALARPGERRGAIFPLGYLRGGLVLLIAACMSRIAVIGAVNTTNSVISSSWMTS